MPDGFGWFTFPTSGQLGKGNRDVSGHAFIGFPGMDGEEERIGFYPTSGWFNNPGRLRDDSNHHYDRKKCFQVCPDQLDKLREYVRNSFEGSKDGGFAAYVDQDNNVLGWATNSNYSVNPLNGGNEHCASWACDALRAAGAQSFWGLSPRLVGWQIGKGNCK
jgi:hypothetical protein